MLEPICNGPDGPSRLPGPNGQKKHLFLRPLGPGSLLGPSGPLHMGSSILTL